MSTLLLRFAAPIQAWGVDSKFNRRSTEREPTKSGVIGFLAAALGRLRADQPGQYLRDYHTAVSTNDESLKFVTERYYLVDAVFLVGMEGDEAFLLTLETAVRAPLFPLYLGRRSCPPTGRVSLGIRQKPLREALMEEIWQASRWYRKRAAPDLKLTLVCDAEHPGALRRRDLPISFAQTHRKYTLRSVDDRADAIPHVSPDSSRVDVSTEHDPFMELEG
jgi:CRISPR system Cascade subunit CasD